MYVGNILHVYTPEPLTTATPNRTLLSHQTHTPPSALPHRCLLARGAPTSSALSSTPPRPYRPQTRTVQPALFRQSLSISDTDSSAARILNAIDRCTINDGVFLFWLLPPYGAGKFRPIVYDVTTGTLGAADICFGAGRARKRTAKLFSVQEEVARVTVCDSLQGPSRELEEPLWPNL